MYNSSVGQSPYSASDTNDLFTDNSYGLRGLSGLQSTINRLFSTVEREKEAKMGLQAAIARCVALGQTVTEPTQRHALATSPSHSSSSSSSPSSSLLGSTPSERDTRGHERERETEEARMRAQLLRVAGVLAFGTFDEEEDGVRKLTLAPESLNENVAFTLDFSFSALGAFECAEMDFCVGDEAYEMHRGSVGSARLGRMAEQGMFDLLVAELRQLMAAFTVLSDGFESTQVHLQLPAAREALLQCKSALGQGAVGGDDGDGNSNEDTGLFRVLRGEGFELARFDCMWDSVGSLPSVVSVLWTGLDAEGGVRLTLDPPVLVSEAARARLAALRVLDGCSGPMRGSGMCVTDALCLANPLVPALGYCGDVKARERQGENSSQGQKEVLVQRATCVFGLKQVFELHCTIPTHTSSLSSSSSVSSAAAMDVDVDGAAAAAIPTAAVAHNSVVLSELVVPRAQLGAALIPALREVRCEALRNRIVTSCFHAARQIELTAGDAPGEEEESQGEVTVTVSRHVEDTRVAFSIPRLQGRSVSFDIACEAESPVARVCNLKLGGSSSKKGGPWSSVQAAEEYLSAIYARSHSVPVVVYYLRRTLAQ
jgi:hypothetical protein